MKERSKVNKVIICVVAFILIVVIGIVLDYTDILYFISEHFNYDFLGIFIPNIVLILYFLLHIF